MINKLIKYSVEGVVCTSAFALAGTIGSSASFFIVKKFVNVPFFLGISAIFLGGFATGGYTAYKTYEYLDNWFEGSSSDNTNHNAESNNDMEINVLDTNSNIISELILDINNFFQQIF